MANKAKTHRGAAARFKLRGKKLVRKKAYKSHILTKMKTKRKRQLRGTTPVHAGDNAKIKRMLRLN